MKIGIMTWFSYDNYGTVLQAYALSQVLQAQAKSVKIIQYYPVGSAENKAKMTPKEFINKIRRRLRANDSERNIVGQISGNEFSEFRDKYLSFSKRVISTSELQQVSNHFDRIVAGSDQVWSPNVFDPHYYLDFVSDPSKKIAYAPSIGVSSITNQHLRKAITKLLQGFPNISIREKAGALLIRDLTQKEVPVVLDPTLLLQQEDWSDLFSDTKQSNSKAYLLAYFLGNDEEYWVAVNNIANQLHLKVLVIPTKECDLTRDGALVKGVGPNDFVQLFNNTSYVCTDSFHGLAFAVNFSKDFTVFERFKEDNTQNQNSRIYNLLDMLHLRERLFDSESVMSNQTIDYSSVQSTLQEKRQQSLLFLTKAINGLKRI